MADLQQTRYDKLIRRVANIVGAGAIVTETLQEVFPVFDLENVPAELMVLGGWRLAMRGTNIAGVAAQEQASQLFNPAGSGMIMVLTRVDLSTSSTQRIHLRMDTTQLTSSNGFGQFRDARAGDPITDAAVGNTRIQANLSITAISAISALSQTTVTIRDENGLCVLMPGNGFTVGTSISNTNLTAAYWWRERVAEAAELNI